MANSRTRNVRRKQAEKLSTFLARTKFPKGGDLREKLGVFFLSFGFLLVHDGVRIMKHTLKLSTSEQTRPISLSTLKATETWNSLVIANDIGVTGWISDRGKNQSMPTFDTAIEKNFEDHP
jgi:hypothetical protein